MFHDLVCILNGSYNLRSFGDIRAKDVEMGREYFSQKIAYMKHFLPSTCNIKLIMLGVLV